MICLCTIYSVTLEYSMTFKYCVTDRWIKKIHPIFQPIEKLVTWEIKWYGHNTVLVLTN
jgi:hypothetical protein